MPRIVPLLPLILVLFINRLYSQACQPSNVIVGAIQANGLPASDLTTANFRALYRGRPLGISFSGFRRDPNVRIVILLDTSPSMAGATGSKWMIARAAASDFVSSASPQAPVSLWTFSTAINLKFDGTGARKPMADWLGSKEVREAKILKGKTALYAAILEALEALAPTRPGDALYLITDGGENADNTNLSRVTRELQSTGVRLFVLLLNDIPPYSREGVGPRELYDVARASGGSTFALNPKSAGSGWAGSGFGRRYDFDPTTENAILATTHWAQAAMSEFYIVTFVRSDAPPQPAAWNLEILDLQGKKRNDLTLLYPSKLEGCSVAAAHR